MLVNNLLVRAKMVKIPWTYYELNENKVEPTKEETDVKMEDTSDEGCSVGTLNSGLTSELDVVNYEGVVVKKITPNPDKNKKKKKKKKNNQKS